MTDAPSPLLTTIGHGKRSIDDVIGLLKRHEIRFVVDVRSAPWSRYQPDFSHDALRDHLCAHDVAYLYMGEELGGRPKDPACYGDDGKVNYTACSERPAFQHGITRLRTAWEQGQRVALLCSENRPEECHRSKLIGPALAEAGIEVTHLDENNALVSQREVMARVHEGQMTLFDDVSTKKTARSRKKYRPVDR